MIWVQGCPIRCPGCFNEELHDFQPRCIIDVDTLTDHMLEIPGIEGVTFSGGEPFAQAEALAELGRNLQAKDLNVVTFSGFSYPTLCTKNRKSWQSLLQVTDLLIAGPYIAQGGSAHPLLASPNQSMIFLSDRLSGRIVPERSYREMELGFDLKGHLTITGFPDQDMCIALGGTDLTKGDVHVALQQGQNQN